MFYDLKSPNIFLKDLKSVLDDDGIIILEQSDLSKMIKANSFDTICHEHLEYYSIRSIKRLIQSNDFKIVHHEFNEANGGSSRFVICHSSYDKFQEYKKLNYLIKKEDNSDVNNGKALNKMFFNLNKIKNNLDFILDKIVKNNLVIHGYGASTKGNTLIQFFKLGRYINLISDRNTEKVGKFTPDKKMRIISEKMSRTMKPDYYFVFPWHFKNNIVRRERSRYKIKTKFIFPLPKIKNFMSKKKAIILGITGQTGSYLAKYLIEKGYYVYGTRRRTSTFPLDTNKLEKLINFKKYLNKRLFFKIWRYNRYICY